MTEPTTEPAPGAADTAGRLDGDALDRLATRACAAFDAGDLCSARDMFQTLLAHGPEHAALHVMLGCIAKYRRDWIASRHHSLRALSLHDNPADAKDAHWNAAIAAIALGERDAARPHWAACGIEVTTGDGGMERAFGVAALRLDAWGRGEIVFARRIDPLRACIIDVPLPESGYRHGDMVLHDAPPTGERRFHQSRVPVFNVLQRLQVSAFPTFAVSVRCAGRDALAELFDLRVPGIGAIEDWSNRVADHRPHGSDGATDERDASAHTAIDRPHASQSRHRLGVAAQGRASVQRLLDRWKANGPGRWPDAIEHRDATPSDPPERGPCWWQPMEDRVDA